MPFLRVLGVLAGVFPVRPLPEGDCVGTADEPSQGVRKPISAPRSEGACHRGPRLAGGFPFATLATLRPLAAGSARRRKCLAPQAAPGNPPHRLRVPGGTRRSCHAAPSPAIAPPVPLAGQNASLHRPLRGTPRIA